MQTRQISGAIVKDGFSDQPARAKDNSPPIYRWGNAANQDEVPAGTKEMGRARFPSLSGSGIIGPLSCETRNADPPTIMHSFVSCLMHCVFATSGRRRLITPDLQQRLWPYLGGIARENRMKALTVGGVEDHVHVLLSIPSTLSLAKSIQLLKGNSSKWIHDSFKEHWDFEWQEGYGAFSIGVSGIEDTTKYIQNQAEHHRRMTFREELEGFLRKHGMEYGERDLE